VLNYKFRLILLNEDHLSAQPWKYPKDILNLLQHLFTIHDYISRIHDLVNVPSILTACDFVLVGNYMTFFVSLYTYMVILKLP
jgi:hypothetical protein